MPLPALAEDGFLPPGLHLASLREVRERFGAGSPERERATELLTLVVEAAARYPTIKRVLVWGSFASAKPAPNDLDYSLVVPLEHRTVNISEPHRRFLAPKEAREFYGADKSFLLIEDYPLEYYSEKLDFLTHGRSNVERGIIEIQLRSEIGEAAP